MKTLTPRWRHAFYALTGAMVLSYGVLGYAFIDRGNQLEKENDHFATLTHTAIQLTKEIQEQRREFVLRTCRDQNERHHALDAFLHKQHITRKSNPTVYVFIDKLAPMRNCRLAVKSATTTAGDNQTGKER